MVQLRADFNLTILAIATGGGFDRATERMVRYLRSARALDSKRPVLVPGDPERQLRARPLVEVDSRTWEEMRAIGRDLQVEIPELALTSGRS